MEVIAVFAPLVGALMAGIFGKRVLGDAGSQFLTCLMMAVASIASILLFKDVSLLGALPGHGPRTVELMTWIQSGTLDVRWSLRFDQLSAVMVFVINIVSCAVHIYSVGYMHHDEAKSRFMSYLSLFTFAMLMLVTSDNFIQLFFGWEGVGLASYLLIGFWHHKESANAAAVKAFVMNRIGDFGLALGIFAVFTVFGTLKYDEVFATAHAMKDVTVEFMGLHFHALSLIAFLLFIGAMGKSAQLGLHTWLPDAMEGPTPVSALIHAATMVTAGVFLVARMSPIYEYAPDVREFITVLGALTAFVAATIGVTQFDIKRVIAYSTMSQLGYMFFALGVSAYGAAMFHLFTHAFFKALLFLGAGSVIHAMSDEQDMRRMGGIARHIKLTYVMMWIGSVALAGLPPLSGFFSKDAILGAAWSAHTPVGHFAYWLGICAAFLTAFYSWRLLFLTFHNQPRADEKVMAHVHESPSIMTMPLAFLAGGAVFAGFFTHKLFIGQYQARFWGESIFVLPENAQAAGHLPFLIHWLPTIVAVAGIFLSWVFYMKARHLPAVMAGTFGRIHDFVYRKWYFDELYQRIGVIPAFLAGRALWKTGDGEVIDGLGPDGIAEAVSASAAGARRMQTGYVYHYAFAMLIGIVAIVAGSLYFLYRQGQ